MTGAACTGEVVEISTYPTDGNSYGGDGNPNVSYYPSRCSSARISSCRRESQHQLSGGIRQHGSSLYLENMCVRTENGKSYVMVRGENGKLEQRWVQTGKVVGQLHPDPWRPDAGGLCGLPHGRDVVSGAKTEEATVDALYSW